MAARPIESLCDLQAHLRGAIHLEQSTVPLYLYGYYSLENPLSDGAQILRRVAMQEMLHVCLATNLLTATNADYCFHDPANVPVYPGILPHHRPQLTLHLQPATEDAVREVFCAIERPMTHRDIPETGEFTTIGQFYAAIKKGFEHLVSTHGPSAVFRGDPARQLSSGYEGGYAASTGSLVRVTDLVSAKAALHEIVHQGEGTAKSEDDGTGGLAHYWLFNQIADTSKPLGRALPVPTDPKMADLPPGELRDLAKLFNDCYGLLLRLMSAVFVMPDTQPERRTLAATLVPLMVRVLKPVALTLMRTPIPGHDAHAGPSFEFSQTTQEQILLDCQRLAGSWPTLVPVVQALTFLPPIDAPRGEEARS